jgi:tyrosine-protein kinase Etk/Wzc
VSVTIAPETVAAEEAGAGDLKTPPLSSCEFGAGKLEATESKVADREPAAYPALDLLILLSRRRHLILWTTLAAAVLATVVALLLPNRYTAIATILPPQQSQSLAASMIGQLGALGVMAQKDLGLKNPNDLYAGMMHSRTAEDSLIRRFDLLRVYGDRKMSDARADLEDASKILLAKEGFIAISVTDNDRSRAPQIANAYVDELRQLTQSLAVTEAGQRRIFFERQLELAKDKLADAEQALKEMEQKTGVIQLDSQAKAIIEAVVKLRGAMAAKEVQLHAMRLFSTEQNPELMMGEQQLSGMREQLALLEKRSGGHGKSGTVSSPDSSADSSEESSDVQVPVGNVPEAGLQYVRKLRDVKYAEVIFELLAKQYEAAKLDEAKTAAVIQVLDPAVEPDHRSSPRRGLIVILATLLAFFSSIFYVFSAEAFSRIRSNPRVDARFITLWNTLGTQRATTTSFQPELRPRS